MGRPQSRLTIEDLETFRPQFLYTLDQLAQVLNLDETDFRKDYVYYAGISEPSVPPKDKLSARDISNSIDHQEWRVTDEELLRWMKYKGFRPKSFWKYI